MAQFEMRHCPHFLRSIGGPAGASCCTAVQAGASWLIIGQWDILAHLRAVPAWAVGALLCWQGWLAGLA